MPMELYSSEAFVRDIVNAISKSEGKPANIGGAEHEGIERDYLFRLISEAKHAIDGMVTPIKKPVAHRLPAQARKAIAAHQAVPKKRVVVRKKKA